MKDFPESLFDDRFRCEPFDIDVGDDSDDMQGEFVGQVNPDYDPDYIPPDDSIPF